MSDPANPLDWIAKAEDDFWVVRSSLRKKTPSTYLACFHAQQCAEKYLKALLISKGKSFPKTHDLLRLDTLCQQAGILIGFDERKLNALSTYAVLTRYPGEDPTLEEARESFDAAKQVRALARKYLGL